MRLEIDPERCQGHGRCALICPDLFVVTDEGFGAVRAASVEEARRGEAQRAIDNCPEQAITWIG